MGSQLPHVIHSSLRAGIVLLMFMRSPQLSWLSDVIPESAPSPYFHIPSPGSNAHAPSGGLLRRAYAWSCQRIAIGRRQVQRVGRVRRIEAQLGPGRLPGKHLTREILGALFKN